MTRRLLMIALVATLALAGCGTTGGGEVVTTQLAGTHTFRKIAVIAMSGSKDERRVFDDAMVRRLGAAGAQGVVGDRYIEDAATANGIEPMQAIRATGADGVLYVWLRRGDGAQPDTTPGVSSWAGAQAAWYQASGTVATVVRFDARLYDVATQKLAWSGSMKLYYPKSIVEDSPQIAERIVGELGKRGVLRSGG